MKRRVRKIANFFAFNLLFFALYLNFIHKDNATVPATTNMAGQQNTAAFSGTVLVETSAQHQQAGTEAAVTTQQPVHKAQENNSPALKLSIN